MFKKSKCIYVLDIHIGVGKYIYFLLSRKKSKRTKTLNSLPLNTGTTWILGIYCCITNCTQVWWLGFIISVSMGEESGHSLAGWFCLRVFHEVAVGMLAEANHLKTWLGPKDPLPRRLTHIAVGRRTRSLASRASSQIRMLHDMAAGIPRAKSDQDRKR